jgi:predicted SAM-dependent methyltransferase
MKLHLGCGKRYLTGFTHIDIENFEHIDFNSGIESLSFIESESVSEIYSSHSFEYFDRKQSKTVLAEWNRVLSPGGSLFLTVPDFESLIKIYSITGKLDAVIGPLFGRWENSENTIYHKTTWDLRTLVSALEGSGFKEVKTFDPVEYLGNIDKMYDDYSLAFYPHMDSSGIQVSLALTARKFT